jgi:hypothetical protein
VADTGYGPPVTRPVAAYVPPAPVVIVRDAPVRVSLELPRAYDQTLRPQRDELPRESETGGSSFVNAVDAETSLEPPRDQS